MTDEKKPLMSPQHQKELDKRREERRQHEEGRKYRKNCLRKVVLQQEHAMNLAMLDAPPLTDEQKNELSQAALKMFYFIATLHDFRTFEEIFEHNEQLEESLYNENRLYKALGKDDARTVLALYEQMLHLILCAQPTIVKYAQDFMAAREKRCAQDTFRENLRR